MPNDEVRKVIAGWLKAELRFSNQREAASLVTEITEAVLNHNGKNDSSDSPVLVALMDADRLVNIELDLVIRCGQFQPDLPAVDFVHLLNDPTANYRNPKSVFRDIFHSLEWETDLRFALRTSKAIEMGKPRFAALRFYLETLEGQIKESGLVPYPFA